MRLKKNNFIAKIFAKGKPECRTYDAREYGLYPDRFDEHACEIVKTLQDNKFEAFVVGGGVRDYLLDLHPKDFDIATGARPEQVQKYFKRAILIGRRFRIVHVYFGRYDFLEVATFRREQPFMARQLKSTVKKSGMIARDNAYGTLEEDAFRRDFTVNALYYDPTHHRIIDFNGGMDDVKKKVLRLIGKPSVRLREDPVRILRALRISNKISFKVDDATLKTIPKFVPLLAEVAGGRLFDEYQKLFLYGDATKNFNTLKEFGILPYFFPTLQNSLDDEKATKMIMHALSNTDSRCRAGKTINPAFLVAVFLWKTLKDRHVVLQKTNSKHQAYLMAVREILKEQTKVTNMPGYLPEFIDHVWGLQRQLELKGKAKVLDILKNSRYRAAYDFLLLRAEIGEVKQSLCQWWNALYSMTEEERVVFLEAHGHNDALSVQNRKSPHRNASEHVKNDQN